MKIKIERGSNYNEELSYETNFYKLVEIYTGDCLIDNLKGIQNTENFKQRFETLFKAWETIIEELKYDNKQNATIVAAAIFSAGHLTLEANIIRNIKNGMEKYADICYENNRMDMRNHDVITYIQGASAAHIRNI